jgi:predicted phage terminase large subunit-like protein
MAKREGPVAKLRRRAEEDFFFFMVEILGYRDLYEPLHGRICRWLQEIWQRESQYSVLMIPRGCFKTTTGSIGLPIWNWLGNQDLKQFVGHGKLGTAQKILRETKLQLETNNYLHNLWPDIFYQHPSRESEVWLADQINVKLTRVDKVPSLMVGSPEASTTGLHYHFQIFDDISTDINSRSENEREKIKQWTREQNNLLRPRDSINPLGGRVLGIGTPWHYDDVWSMLRGPDYEDDCSSMILGMYGDPGLTDGEPIFPTRFPKEEIEKRVKRMGTTIAAAQLFCDPNPEAWAKFKMRDIRWFHEGDVPAGMNIFAAVDPNRSEKTQDDPMAIIVGGVDSEGELWVLDRLRGHPVGQEILDWFAVVQNKWNPKVFFVESISAQNQIIHWVRQFFMGKGMAVQVKPVVRGPTRKYERIMALQPMVEAGKLHIPYGFEDVAEELCAFPNGKNDDMCDCLADLYAHGFRPSAEKAHEEVPNNPYVLQSIINSELAAQNEPRVSFSSAGRSFGRSRVRFRG